MRPFAYERGTTIGAGQTALAGGTTLLDLMKLDVMRPERVVDLGDLKHDHATIEVRDGALRLGAFATMSEAAEQLSAFPLIRESLLLAASAQIRNMATLGGNVLQRTRCPYFRDTGWACNKRSPGSGCAALTGPARKHAVLGTSQSCIATYPGDFAQALVALRAEVVTSSRRFPFAELHRLPEDTPHLENTLEEGEAILGFVVPDGPWARRSTYLKIRDRASYEFALASAAVGLHVVDGKIAEARVALGGVATVPWRSVAAEDLLTGAPLDEETATRAAEAAFETAVAHGDDRFKIALGKQTLVRAILSLEEAT